MTDETFEQAARTYGDMLYRVAYHTLRNRADAEDVVQNVLLKLYQQESCFESEDHMKHWLLRVTVNESRKLLRSFWRRHAVPLDQRDELPPPGVRDLHADYGNYCYKGLRHSLCHGWASAPCFWLSETLSGVRFLSPGGGELSVTPRLAGLQWMHIGIPTPRGPVTIEQEAGKVPEIRLPEGVRLVPQEPCC